MAGLDPWRYLIFDMKTFGVIAEVNEVGDPSIQEVLNTSPNAKVTIPFGPDYGFSGDPTNLYGFQYYDIAMPRAGLAIEKNGVLVFAGPILIQNFNLADGTLELNAQGIFEIFKRRICSHNHLFNSASSIAAYVPSGYAGTGWDQAWIAKFFIDEMQQQPNGYLNIVTSFYTTGTKREFSTKASDVKDYHQIISDRAALYGGFDFRFFPRWKNGIRNSEIEWNFEIFYPPEGRPTEILFELGSNVDFTNIQVDGSQISYAAYSVMEANGDIQQVGYSEDVSARASNYRLEWVDREHTDVKVLSTANFYAQLTHRARANESKIPNIVAPIDIAEEFLIGDQVRVKADYGLAKIDSTFRIVDFTLSPKAGIVTMNVAPLGLTGLYTP